jgi:hypothetical protein
MKKLLVCFFVLVLVGCGEDNSFDLGGSVLEDGINEEGITSDVEEFDTSDWLTYRDEELGFEVRYPREWEVKELTVVYPDRYQAVFPSFSIVIAKKFKKNDLGRLYAELPKFSININKSGEKSHLLKLVKEEKELIKLGNCWFKKKWMENGSEMKFFSLSLIFENNAKNFEEGFINLQGVYFKDKPHDSKILEKIAATAKFNQRQEITVDDWATYRNEELGFEIKYPTWWLATSQPSTYDVASFGPSYSMSGGLFWNVSVQEENTESINNKTLIQLAKLDTQLKKGGIHTGTKKILTAAGEADLVIVERDSLIFKRIIIKTLNKIYVISNGGVSTEDQNFENFYQSFTLLK